MRIGTRTSRNVGLGNFRHFANKYKYSLIAIIVIVVVWSVAAAVSWNHFETKRMEAEVSSSEELSSIDEDIERIKKKKEAEQKLQEEKEAQEAAEAEAKKKAEEEARKLTGGPDQGVSGGGSSCNTTTTHINPTAVDVLVNKKHCLVPLSFTPPDLVTTHGATISAKAVNDFNRMFTDAAAAGQAFTVSSSYRSYATQVSTYNYWVSINGQNAADTVSARPGYSEHQTGLAIDVAAGGCTLDCFGGTSQYQWLQANAASYGFVQRYYSGYESITGYASEEWHYRYVGIAVAQDMKAKGIKTLEQYWGMEGGNYR